MKHLSKVFVIDSNLASLVLFENTLGAQGYRVKCFTSAEDFLAQYHPTQIGCLLIDLALPEMGGSQLLERLQESGSLLSAIILTSVTDSAVVSRIEWSSVTLVQKPYELSTLLNAVVDGIAASVWRRSKQLRSEPRDEPRPQTTPLQRLAVTSPAAKPAAVRAADGACAQPIFSRANHVSRDMMARAELATLHPCVTSERHLWIRMINQEPSDDRVYTHLLTLMSVSAAMVGVCLTAVGLVSVIEVLNKVETWIDDLLAIGSLIFSIVTLLSFLGIRTRIRYSWKRFTLLLDILFCCGIMMMVAASMVLTWVVIKHE